MAPPLTSTDFHNHKCWKQCLQEVWVPHRYTYVTHVLAGRKAGGLHPYISGQAIVQTWVIERPSVSGFIFTVINSFNGVSEYHRSATTRYRDLSRYCTILQGPCAVHFEGPINETRGSLGLISGSRTTPRTSAPPPLP